jgi:hypothetical protein
MYSANKVGYRKIKSETGKYTWILDSVPEGFAGK